MAAPDSQEADLLCLLRIYTGDMEALAELYDRHTPLLHAVCTAILGDEREADDLVYRTWMVVWTRTRLYDRREGPVANWLLALLRHDAIDALGERPRRPEAADLVEGARKTALQAPNLSAEAVREFPALERQALEAAFFKGMHYTRLAAHLEVEPAAAKNLLRRGLEHLLGGVAVREPV
ncbi:MAG: sigma-70 family RNA polymerase sigma factor [Gemmatimonadales bacterium]|nr:MAG: sigma-70 family RNA polymerase sigma factor [Gemmatimonadales bacterium]